MAWTRAAVGALLVLSASLVALCWGLYAFGATDFPSDMAPSAYRAPPALRARYLRIEADGVETLPRMNPVSAWGYLALAARQHEPANAQLSLLGHTAHHVLLRNPHHRGGARWHLASWAASIRISRDWTLDQAIDTHLAESRFGRGATGIEQAARAWYGRPLDDLGPEESLALIALLKGPGYYDPICKPEHFADRYLWTASHTGMPDPQAALRNATARMLPSTCPAPFASADRP